MQPEAQYAIREEEGKYVLYYLREPRDLFIDAFPSRQAAEEYQKQHREELERSDNITTDFRKWVDQWIVQKASETGLEESYIKEVVSGEDASHW